MSEQSQQVAISSRRNEDTESNYQKERKWWLACDYKGYRSSLEKGQEVSERAFGVV